MATDSSVLNESSTQISSAHETDSRHAPRVAALLKVVMNTESFLMLRTRSIETARLYCRKNCDEDAARGQCCADPGELTPHAARIHQGRWGIRSCSRAHISHQADRKRKQSVDAYGFITDYTMANKLQTVLFGLRPHTASHFKRSPSNHSRIDPDSRQNRRERF